MLLTSTVDVVRWWKEYFEDLLNTTNMSSMEDTEPLNFELDSPIIGIEIAVRWQGSRGG